MTKTLADRERSFMAALTPPDMAKRLVPRLRELADELSRDAKMATGSRAELRHLEAQWVASAADLIIVLETEQFRQREAARHFIDGRMDRLELRAIAWSWNNENAAASPPTTAGEAGG